MIANTAVSIDDFRTNLANLMGQVMYGQNRVFVKKYNQPAAVLLGVDDYEKLLDPTKRLTQEEWDKQFDVFDRVQRKVPKANWARLEKAISRAIIDVRAKKG